MLPDIDPPIAFWNGLLSEEAKRLAALLGKVDAYLGHKQLIAPWWGCSGPRKGRPSTLVDTLRVLDPPVLPPTLAKWCTATTGRWRPAGGWDIEIRIATSSVPSGCDAYSM